MTTPAEVAPSMPRSEGIWANVELKVSIHPKTHAHDQVDSEIRITAINKTDAAIPLIEPYVLPVRKAFIADSRTEAGVELVNDKREKEIAVYFGDNVIPAKGQFTWVIKYSRTTVAYLENILTYARHFKPPDNFQNTPVRKHHFTIIFELYAPSHEKWRKLREWRVYQRNSLDVDGETTRESPNCTIYKVTQFDLYSGQGFDIRLACEYAWMNWIARAFEIAVAALGTIILEHSPAVLLSLWHSIHGAQLK
jgi:hypothetical protein